MIKVHRPGPPGGIVLATSRQAWLRSSTPCHSRQAAESAPSVPWGDKNTSTVLTSLKRVRLDGGGKSPHRGRTPRAWLHHCIGVLRYEEQLVSSRAGSASVSCHASFQCHALPFSSVAQRLKLTAPPRPADARALHSTPVGAGQMRLQARTEHCPPTPMQGSLCPSRWVFGEAIARAPPRRRRSRGQGSLLLDAHRQSRPLKGRRW